MVGLNRHDSSAIYFYGVLSGVEAIGGKNTKTIVGRDNNGIREV